jgi:phenylacetate-CoA ligase
MAETYWERKLWEPDIETMSRKELRELQKRKLFPQLIYAYENAPLYKELYDKEKVDVYKIRTIEDFQKYVPSVDKEMFREYRERTGNVFGGICCLSIENRIFRPLGYDLAAGRFCRSTGTTGMPTCFMYTERDTRIQATLGAREWWRAGVRPNDRMALFHSDVIGWHGGPIPYELAALKEIGAFYYIEAMNMWEMGLNLSKLFDVNILYFVLHNSRAVAQEMEKKRTTVKDSILPHLKVASVTGELSKSSFEYEAKMFGVPVVSHTYVTDAAFIQGCCFDEAQQTGAALYQHFPEDMFFIELFPVGSDKAVEGADFGELVITSLFSESMAFIRFNTEDTARMRYDPCPYCGYTHVQGRVMSRVTESVNVGGKIITMAEVEDVTQAHPETRFLPTQLVREEPQPQDKLRIKTCYNAELVKEPEQFKLQIEEECKKQFAVEALVDLITPEEVKGLFHKFERVIKEKRQS